MFDIPSYPEPPAYSPNPTHGEERLYFNAAPNRSPTGTFHKSGDHFSIVLRGQDNVEYPSYGRGSSVSGVVNVKDTRGIQEIRLKIAGYCEVISQETGVYRQERLNETHILWDAAQDGKFKERGGPESLSFSVVLPTEFHLEGETRLPLPPSVSFESDTLSVNVIYRITVSSSSQRRLSFWKCDEELSVEMNYYPRSRPTRPIPLNHQQLSWVKVSPDEWFQIQSSMKYPRIDSDAQNPIQCEFFIPASRIFAISDHIPFHLQLRGSPMSLFEFLPPKYHFQSSTASATAATTSSTSTEHPLVKVEILRQILVVVGDKRVWRNLTLGVGQIQAVLLPASLSSESPTAMAKRTNNNNNIDLHWEGYVRCKESVLLPSFNVGTLVFKDFIMLTIQSRNPNSEMEQLKLPVSITLVTDPWVDSTNREDAHTNATMARTSTV